MGLALHLAFCVFWSFTRTKKEVATTVVLCFMGGDGFCFLNFSIGLTSNEVLPLSLATFG